MHKRVKETFSPISKLRLPFLFKTLKGEGWVKGGKERRERGVGRRMGWREGRRKGKGGMERGNERWKEKLGLERRKE